MWRPDPAFRRGLVGASSLDFLAAVTAGSGSRSVALGDADGDGDLDVYALVTKIPAATDPQDFIYRNDGLRFTPVPVPVPVPSARGVGDAIHRAGRQRRRSHRVPPAQRRRKGRGEPGHPAGVPLNGGAEDNAPDTTNAPLHKRRNFRGARSFRGDLGGALTRPICLPGRGSSPVETEAFVCKEGSCASVSGGEWPSSA